MDLFFLGDLPRPGVFGHAALPAAERERRGVYLCRIDQDVVREKSANSSPLARQIGGRQKNTHGSVEKDGF